MANERTTERIQGYCALCVSRCGSIAVVQNGRFESLEPDPSHPTGKALCAKGRAAPELVYHPERLLYPLKRTRSKTGSDPGWQRIGWDEALDLVADKLNRIKSEHGAESVVFSVASPSTSASDDSLVWIERLANSFGSPNVCMSVELCGWGRYMASLYTFGESVPGIYRPDLENAGCILFWGYNPNLARLAHATATADALKRGAKLMVVDPRRTGPAKKADIWLRVRPGSDGALALGIAGEMITHGWYDRDFIRKWSNGPLLVRSDNGRLLTERDLISGGDERRTFAWSEAVGRLMHYDPATCSYERDDLELALFGQYTIETQEGEVPCRTVFDLVAGLCQSFSPQRVEAICGVGREQVAQAARMLWEARPTAYYAWSGVEMQSNATQIGRAIAQLYALTGSFDIPGGNVFFPSPPAAEVEGRSLLPESQRLKTLGLQERPLGPARFGYVTSEELYCAVLDKRPYAVRGLVGFGANLLLSHSDTDRGREALQSLDFYVHADLFMNPTAELADVVLPVASAFEREALKIGFETSLEAQSRIQLRKRVVDPPGGARSDTEIVFALAQKLGLSELFWDGNIEAAIRYQLEPSGVSMETLKANPGGVKVPQSMRYRKYAEISGGTSRGFQTPSRKVELYSETMLENGYPALPEYEEPLMGPILRADLAGRYPLILTCAKHTLFCESQHRGLPSLRRRAPDPQVEMHPAAAAERGIKAGDWVTIETPIGASRARARFNDSLDPQVVCGQHGWWQACIEIGAPGYDPFRPDGANFNRMIDSKEIDPVSGSVPHRAFLCEVRLAV